MKSNKNPSKRRIGFGVYTASAILASTFPHAVLAQNEPALEEVIVTGSRIVRRDLTAASPYHRGGNCIEPTSAIRASGHAIFRRHRRRSKQCHQHPWSSHAKP